jgi:hypothetical protein
MIVLRGRVGHRLKEALRLNPDSEAVRNNLNEALRER